ARPTDLPGGDHRWGRLSSRCARRRSARGGAAERDHPPARRQLGGHGRIRSAARDAARAAAGPVRDTRDRAHLNVAALRRLISGLVARPGLARAAGWAALVGIILLLAAIGSP